MNIGIVGFGRMGKQVLACCRERSVPVISIIDPFCVDSEVSAKSLDETSVSGCDCMIDFSSGDCAVDNILFYSRNSIPAVVGTTGWMERADEVKKLLDPNAKIICSANFSIGVALFMRIAREACLLFDKFTSYDIAVRETHHSMKADAPSGTADMIAQTVLSSISRKKRVLCANASGRIPSDSLQVVSQRVGGEPGFHELLFDSAVDTISISHHARSRAGFANGAVDAAQWLVDQPPGFYSIDDYVDGVLGRL